MGVPHVVVVGAGMGGLSAAIALAARGFRVTVYEKLDRPGGKMGEVRLGGFRWDTGPSVITMRFVYEWLFALAGRRLEDYVELLPLEPLTRYFWRDGMVLDATADVAEMQRRIAARFGEDEGQRYRRFVEYTQRLYEVVREPFLFRHKPTFRDLFRLPLVDVLKIDALRSMHHAVRAHFRSPHLVQLFDRFATYNGSSPYLAPATLNVIAFVEMVQGAWYPRGGVFQLARAFEQLAGSLGVELCYGTAVEQIVVREGRAVGVVLQGGRFVPADAVVCNADYVFARQTLLPSGSALRHLSEPSCSGFVLLMGVRGQFAQLAHHNVFFGRDYAREFSDIFAYHLPPAEPTIYLCVTSKTDLDHAPHGFENWFVLVNVPSLLSAFSWSRHADSYAELVKRCLCEWIVQISGKSPEIVVEQQWTPLDLQRMFGGYLGSIYGFSSNTRLAAFARPGNRDPNIRRLYFAGGSVHPGGGVPLVTLSGMAAARCVAEDVEC
ncbi:MAG: phytoene desaturase family protein [Anaerolineae bacterium]|nr:phytoene desaturase family protein [Anaerolineae bacterium]